MTINNILVFDLTGDFAHFRLGYTTSSSSTHLVPPRHTIAGLLGAITGLERNQVAEVFHPDNCSIGITIENKLSLIRISINQLLVKGKATLKNIMTHEQHSQIPFQMIKNPHYRIYVSHEDESFHRKLKELLQNHECVYPPALGMAQLLGDTRWIKEISSTQVIKSGLVKTKSVAPLQMFNPQPDTMHNHMVMDRQARHLSRERQPDQFFRVVFDSNGEVPLSGELLEESGPATPVVIESDDDIPEVVFLW